MEGKIIQVATSRAFGPNSGPYLRFLGAISSPCSPCLQLPAEPPLASAVTLLRLLLKTNPKHKLKINLARSDKYWV